jgi:hypothetical protein
MMGLLLLGDGLHNRVWAWTFAAAGAFYGLFGVIRLGVWMDLVLLGGAAALAVVATPRPKHAAFA